MASPFQHFFRPLKAWQAKYFEMLELPAETLHVSGMLTPAQVRAACALLGWSRTKLAEESGVPYGTLTDFEGKRTRMLTDSLAKLARTLDKAGVEFFMMAKTARARA